MPRDDFSKVVIDILAKRVGYLCSNPTCKKSTVGANSAPLKATIMGVAAHMTAASPGGPRFDSSLSQDERSSIDNGIWLCVNCSTLIDKDPSLYDVNILRDWKLNAEEQSRIFMSSAPINDFSKIPFLEADLIWTGGGRRRLGISNNNPVVEIDGRPTVVFGPGRPLPIIYWQLFWCFNLAIYNNSEGPAYNVSITSYSDESFTTIEKLKKVNNLPAFQHIDLKATFEYTVEGTYLEADEQKKHKIPLQLEGLQFLIKYVDSARNEYSTMVTIKNNELINERI
ncbi:MAG TPA: hypothetical protein VGN00_20320 [Puia sp.]|jgi:hypothetical protein